jgi:hypothetical protein
MVRTTDATTTESITTTEAAADLVEGDTVEVEYESNRSDATKSFTATVTNVDVTTTTTDGLFGWVDVDLCRDVTESGDDLADDDFPRRRLSFNPGDSWEVEARATTKNGAEYRRISSVVPNPDVAQVVEAEVDDTDDDDRDPFDMTPTDAEIAAAFGVDDVDDITDEMLEDVDVPDVPDTVDVSDYKTAAGAAKKTHEAIQDHAESMGYNRDGVNLYAPEDAYQGYDAWAVVWEGGPYEWGLSLTGGQSLTAGEGPGFGGGDPEVTGLLNGAGFDVEPHFSFDLVFFDH